MARLISGVPTLIRLHHTNCSGATLRKLLSSDRCAGTGAGVLRRFNRSAIRTDFTIQRPDHGRLEVAHPSRASYGICPESVVNLTTT